VPPRRLPGGQKEQKTMNLFASCAGQRLGAGLCWLNEPLVWSFDADGRLTVEPPAKTDFFRPPGQEARDDACLLHVPALGDFTLTARVAAHLVDFGDAVGLMLRRGPDCWAKLCVERSPVGEVAIVSVVTGPWSDDANGELLARPEAYLRLTRRGELVGMHYSVHGDRWRFVRAFTLGPGGPLAVGLHAQAPFAGGCRGTCDFLRLEAAGVADYRSGQ
jgi:uncharacterized protein